MPASSDQGLTLTSQHNGQDVSLVLHNAGVSAETVSQGYALSGLGGGNLIPLVVSSFGQLIPPCAYMDSLVAFKLPAEIGAGKRIVVWKGSVRSVARLHCLEAGRYSLAFSYINAKGEMVFTRETYWLDVGDNFKSTLSLARR